jgi:hypothetical protein
MKSPRRSTDSLAAGARNVLATYDRLVADAAIGSVEGVAKGVGVGEVVGEALGLGSIRDSAEPGAARFGWATRSTLSPLRRVRNA